MMIGVALALILAAREQTAQAVLATADDCAVLVAAARSDQGWGPNGPTRAFDTDPAGFWSACHWSELGVGAPKFARFGKPADPRFAASKPQFNAGRTSATVVIDTIIPDGRPNYAPFVSQSVCTVRKQGAAWTLNACVQGAIT